jgi:transcriptional regulator with XRE-family HTH domain
MQCGGELELLTKFVRGVVIGPRVNLDAVDEKAVEALRREPLHAWLLKVARSGCKVRGAQDNSVREVLELLEQVRSQSGISKQELARRSGVSRGHLSELFGLTESRPVMETIVRIAVGLDFPLEVVAQDAVQIDDAVEPGAALTPNAPGTVTTTVAETGWRQAGVFSVCMISGALIPIAGGGKAYVGCGLVGAAAAGVGLVLDNQRKREVGLFVGAGVIAGALVAGACRLVGALTGKGGNDGK